MIGDDYKRKGYERVESLFSEQTVREITKEIKACIFPNGRLYVDQDTKFAPVLQRPAFFAYGPYSSLLRALLLGLTPAMEMLARKPLVPTYNYFRIYRRNDICKIHSDRLVCDHSLSIMLSSSEQRPWSFDIGVEDIRVRQEISDHFGDEAFESIDMKIGDSVAYRGALKRHGRIQPNPNTWSAHLFCHWVERDSNEAALGYEGAIDDEDIALEFV